LVVKLTAVLKVRSGATADMSAGLNGSSACRRRSVRYGLWPSLFASVVASPCYNFFFLPPLYTFTIADPTNVAAFFFLTIMAIVVSNVAAQKRASDIACDLPIEIERSTSTGRDLPVVAVSEQGQRRSCKSGAFFH
jgi:hypothetical protein